MQKQLNNNLKFEIMEGLFVPLAFFLAIFAILYVYWTTRTKERLALIDKGLDSSIFKKDKCSKYILMKWGIFLISLGVGVIAAYLLSQAINEVAAYFSMILLCGGLGLMVANIISNRLSEKQ